MHVYFLSYNFRKNTPSTRYRGTYPLKALNKKHQIKTTQFYRKKDIFYLFYIYLQVRFSKEKTIVIFQRIVQKDKISRLMELIRKAADKSILDIDDAIEDLSSSEKSKNYICEWISKTEEIWVGSKELKNNYQKYNTNIKIMSTPVPTPLTKKIFLKNKILIIGWIGNYAPHKENLEMFFKIIVDIQMPIRLKLVGITDKQIIREIDIFFKNSNIIVEYPKVNNWNNENEINSVIKTFDIGIMPQLNTKYDRAKSAFKLKQYLSNGIPVLASPVGENLEVVIEGKNGYFCNNQNEWMLRIKEINSFTNNEYEKICNNALSLYKESDYFMDNYIEKILEQINF